MHRVQRERLPFAFVCANDKLIANCEQQLIRQTTRADSGALGDCYTFAARSVEGLRTNVDRVAYLRLHMLMAARRLWAPNTIARLHEWVPTQPLGPDAIYRREDYERYNNLPQAGSNFNIWGTQGLRRTQLLDDDLWGGHIGPGDYAYHLGGVPGLGGAYFGPHWPDEDWVDPDMLQHPPTFGRMGMRSQGDREEAQPEEEDEIPPAPALTRQVSFSDDSFSSDDEEEAIVNFFKETHIAMTKDIVEKLKMTKKRVNHVLYALAQVGVITRVLTSPPTWEYNGKTTWEEMLVERDPTESKLTSVDLDKGTPASRPLLTRFSQLVRERRQVVDPTEIGRGEHRDSPENPLVGFSTHTEEAIRGEHLMGDVSYLGEKMTFEVRGGKATLDYTQQMDKAGTREARKAQEEERNCMLESGEIEGLAEKNIRAWNGTWEPVPEAGNIPGVHIARPTIGNVVKAMRERHFKIGAEVGQMSNKTRVERFMVCTRLCARCLMNSNLASGPMSDS